MSAYGFIISYIFPFYNENFEFYKTPQSYIDKITAI